VQNSILDHDLRSLIYPKSGVLGFENDLRSRWCKI
jgi:hypothetical protein